MHNQISHNGINPTKNPNINSASNYSFVYNSGINSNKMNNSGNIFANEMKNNSNINSGYHFSHSSLFNNRVVKSNENFDNNKRHNDIHSGRISN